jgi:hypothetical protein
MPQETTSHARAAAGSGISQSTRREADGERIAADQCTRSSTRLTTEAGSPHRGGVPVADRPYRRLLRADVVAPLTGVPRSRKRSPCTLKPTVVWPVFPGWGG